MAFKIKGNTILHIQNKEEKSTLPANLVRKSCCSSDVIEMILDWIAAHFALASVRL